MTIQAVFFDIGGVLVRTEDLEPRRRWERRLNLPEWGLERLVHNSPAAQRATIGTATIEEAWAEAHRLLNEHALAHYASPLTPAEMALLRAEFYAGDRADGALLAFIAGLRPRYRTGVISNAWPNARAAWRGLIDEATFDVLVFSAEAHCRKPDPAIYHLALNALNVPASAAVFVDDVLDNVRTAEALGMTAIHFQPGVDVPARLRAAGVM